jgi:sigma-E factor negative regulatory protein RseA
VKNKVSELMDGELSDQDVEKIIATLKQEDLLNRNWEIYHLIGDTLRQSSNLTTNVAKRVSRQLASEPILLVPETLRKPSNQAWKSHQHQTTEKIKSGSSKTKVFAFATAASLFAMISTWVVMQNVYQQSHPIIVAEQSRVQTETNQLHVPMNVLHTSGGNQYPYVSNGDMTNYLYFHSFHKELSPGSTIIKHPAYVYPVTQSTDNYGR